MSEFIDAGTTKRQTRIRYNSMIENADVFLVLSDIKPHYFAGYSNPVKNFVPGICDYETARGNHSLTLDDASSFCAHPWHPNPAQQNQPLEKYYLKISPDDIKRYDCKRIQRVFVF